MQASACGHRSHGAAGISWQFCIADISVVAVVSLSPVASAGCGTSVGAVTAVAALKVPACWYSSTMNTIAEYTQCYMSTENSRVEYKHMACCSFCSASGKGILSIQEFKQQV